MSYRQDPDLDFLKNVPSEDLNDLIHLLTHDKDENLRFSQELTHSPVYKRNFPNHNNYWHVAAAEIQKYGGNTFLNLLRGDKGVLYRELLFDVSHRLKVKTPNKKNVAIEVIEQSILLNVLRESLDKMNADELKQLCMAVGLKNKDGITPEAAIAAFQAIFRAGGFKSYQLTLITANAVLKAIIGRGLSFAANRTLVKAMSILSGPVGMGVTAAWTAIDVAGPAYRVTIPAVLQISALRQKHSNAITN